MKNCPKFIGILALVVIIGLVACDNPADSGNTPPPQNIAVTGVSLDNFKVGKDRIATIPVIIMPDNASNKRVTWEIGDTAIVELVEGNKVKGLELGNTTITATTEDGGFSASCTVTVETHVDVIGISLNKSSLSLAPSQQEQLNCIITPSNATNQNVTWSSSNTAVATVNNGLIEAKAIGNATITVTTEDKGFSAVCAVTVYQAPAVQEGYITMTVAGSNPQDYYASSFTILGSGTVTVNWGDGSQEQTMTNNTIGYYGDEFYHVYEDDSSYTITVWYDNILSLKLGINRPQLRSAYTSVNLSGCTTITEFYEEQLPFLTSVNASGCTALKYLGFFATGNITTVNVTGCTALEMLDVSGNKLTTLDVSTCTALTSLECSSNELTALDVSNNHALESLSCAYNELSTLNVSNKTALKRLSCEGNKLTSLNVGGCTALTSLYCTNNQLTTLNASGLTALERLYCENNQITSLNVSGTAFTSTSGYFYTSDNPIESLNFSGCASLTHVSAGYSQLKTLNVSDCTALTYLFVTANQLSSLNVTGCTALTNLECLYTKITSLDVSTCTALEKLNCEENNQLTTLNLSGCIALTELLCRDSRLTALDVSTCILLGNGRVLCGNNNMSTSALNTFFNTLPQAGSWGVVIIGGNPGTSSCNRTIATSKGWSVYD